MHPFYSIYSAKVTDGMLSDRLAGEITVRKSIFAFTNPPTPVSRHIRPHHFSVPHGGCVDYRAVLRQTRAVIISGVD